MRNGLEILHVISFLLLLGSGDFQVRELRVTGKDGPTEALRGEDVTIPCLLSGVPIPLNLEKLSVVWTLRLQNGTEREVYGFYSSRHKSSRIGSHMNDKDLQQGNASLSIPNIHITDEGDYRCFVIFTPDAGYGTSTLQVSVKPQTALSHDQHIEDGITGSVRCEVNNFYPEAVKIRWVKFSKSNSRSSPWDKDVYFTTLLGNSDGTFSVTSVLTLEPTTDAEPGDVFSCIVSHRYLEEKIITLSFTMTRRNPVIGVAIAAVVLGAISCVIYCLMIGFIHRSGPMMKVVFGVIFTVLSIIILVLSGLSLYFWNFVGTILVIFALLITILVLLMLPLYWIRFWRDFIIDNTIISDIIGETWLLHEERTTLSFQITGFRKKEIHINLYLKRPNDMKKHLIHSWVSVVRPSCGSNYTMYDTTLPVEMKVEMKKTKDGNHECGCRISLTPDADTDDGAVLSVEVAHAALRWPLYRYHILNVIKGEKSNL